ncbi:hypothetical protein, partial [uncultured Duncaniella sp.]|uniref:hypothetical protein n=1 Tax=uncultured Duncaniella sp. TaxID=2768039 RepID=UPI002657D78A
RAGACPRRLPATVTLLPLLGCVPPPLPATVTLNPLATVTSPPAGRRSSIPVRLNMNRDYGILT